MSSQPNFHATLPRIKPLGTSLAAIALGGLLVVAGLGGRIGPPSASPIASASVFAANAVMEQRAIAEARRLAAPLPSHRMSEAELLERIAIDESHALASASASAHRPVSVAEVLEQRELREANELADR